MTQSCYVQMSSSDMMSSSMHGGLNDLMMSNSMIMTNNGSIMMGNKGKNGGERSRATAWNEYANNSEGISVPVTFNYLIFNLLVYHIR